MHTHIPIYLSISQGKAMQIYYDEELNAVIVKRRIPTY